MRCKVIRSNFFDSQHDKSRKNFKFGKTNPMKTHENRCRNCRQHLLLHQRFCHQCGQKTDTHRINLHFLIHELQHGVFHVDSGILFTIRELFTRPGHSIREYIDGKRKPHFPPFTLVVILGSVCALVQYFFKKESKEGEGLTTKKGTGDASLERYVDFEGLVNYFRHIIDWFTEHFAFTVLLVLPVAALGYFLGFRKYRINYPEWLVIMLFLAGQSLVLYIPFIFLNHFLGNQNGWFFLLSWGMITFSLMQFFDERGNNYVLLRSLWSTFLTYFFSLIYLVLAALIFTVIGILLYGYEGVFTKIIEKI